MTHSNTTFKDIIERHKIPATLAVEVVAEGINLAMLREDACVGATHGDLAGGNIHQIRQQSCSGKRQRK